jgi:hypothetical protein
MHTPSFVEPTPADESSDDKVVVMPARTFADEPGLEAGADVSSEVVTVNDTCNIRSACDLCSNKLQYTYLRRFRRVSILGCIFLSTVRALWFLLVFGSGRFGLPLAIF